MQFLGRNGDQERLPSGAYQQLAAQLWFIGSIGARDLIESAPAPCTAQKSFERDDTLLELGFRLRVDSTSGLNTVIGYRAALSSIEDYEPWPGFTLYTYRQLDLRTPGHKQGYQLGAEICGPEGELIQIDLEAPSAGTKRYLGSVAWRQLRHQLEDKFTRGDFDYFSQQLELFGSELANGAEL